MLKTQRKAVRFLFLSPHCSDWHIWVMNNLHTVLIWSTTRSLNFFTHSRCAPPSLIWTRVLFFVLFYSVFFCFYIKWQLFGASSSFIGLECGLEPFMYALTIVWQSDVFFVRLPWQVHYTPTIKPHVSIILPNVHINHMGRRQISNAMYYMSWDVKYKNSCVFKKMIKHQNKKT